jgi:hypothetical protein
MRTTDAHLKTLQSLAAHLKLLLDTPEHLWRLIERKKYLHAGWLFLLARVIHHALVRPATEGDEEDWKTHGIDVEVRYLVLFSYSNYNFCCRSNSRSCSANGIVSASLNRKFRTKPL